MPTSPLQLLLEPLQETFLQRAIGVGVIVAVVCAVLSCFMTLKGWALMGDAVSHAVLPGVVLAYAFHLPFAVGAFAFGVGSVGLIGWIRQHTRLKEDAVIGLVFSGFFALGLVLISRLRSNVDLGHILFGNLLGISDADLGQTLAIALVVLGVLLVRGRDLLLFCFDPSHARSIGQRTGALHYMLLSQLSQAAVAGLQAVGIILVVAMLITPGATGYLLTDRFGRMVALAVLSAVLATVLGVLLSYWIDASTAGCIVLMLTLQFALVMVLAPRHGLLAQRRRRQRRTSPLP
ncbi:MAG: metal ABC transporter permease [Cyanobacteriota bacterium]